MRSEVTVLGLSVIVCLSVYDYSRTTGYKAAYERYQQLQCYIQGHENRKSNFAEKTVLERYGVETSEKSICTGLPRPGLAHSAHRGRIKLLRGCICMYPSPALL